MKTLLLLFLLLVPPPLPLSLSQVSDLRSPLCFLSLSLQILDSRPSISGFFGLFGAGFCGFSLNFVVIHRVHCHQFKGFRSFCVVGDQFRFIAEFS